MLNIIGRRCVVVGGGRVALRKAKGLLDYNGSVTVVSPWLCPELEKLAGAGRIDVVRHDYNKGDLYGAFLAVAATDDALVNQEVAHDAAEKGVLINIADDPNSSDFIVPSSGVVGDIILAVGTTGQSPALARKIRLMLEEELGKGYAALLDMVSKVRLEMMRQGRDIDTERWQAALDMDALLKLVQSGEMEKARQALLEKLEDAD
jgi:siroheme synthase-like protein